MKNLCLLLVVLAATAGLALHARAGGDEAPPASPPGDEALPENFERVSDQLYRSAQPVGVETFKALAAKGIKVVVSVDGARPDVEAARAAGLRYIHIPFGYDGVPRDKELLIAKVVRTLDGPFLFHCHHGKHRGPAGCAIAWRTLDAVESDALMEFLKVAGTSPKYAGLYRDVAGYRPPTDEELAQVPAEFPEYVPPQGLTAGMVAADHGFERMTDVRKAGWRTSAAHPDVNPPHEATILAEAFREMARLDESKQKPEDFQKWMQAAEDACWKLSDLLGQEQVDGEKALAAYTALQTSCNDCHAVYRNNR
jgi:protein tyrosine phosphatase (PTP) superfamily phosphohydrolase (DUF442 family)